MISLNFKQRFDLQKYTGLLYSTVQLRMSIQPFWDELMLSIDEQQNHNVKSDEFGDSIVYDDNAPLKAINEPDDVVKNAMKHYISEGKAVGKTDNIFNRAVETFNTVL